MNKIHREKLYNRITYVLFTCLMIVTMFFPMFSLKTVTGSESVETCQSVSAIQVMRVAFSDTEELVEKRVNLEVVYSKAKDDLIADGKTLKEAEEAMKTNAAYNEACLIDANLIDSKALKPLAISLLVSYILAAVLALMFILNFFIRKDILDIIAIFGAAVVAVSAVVALVISFSTTVVITSVQKILVCSEMMMYVYMLLPLMLAIVQAIQLFLLQKARKAQEKEVIKPFTGMQEDK